MNAPRIAPLHEVRFHEPELLAGLPVDPAVDESVFVVVASGVFHERWFERGEVLICRGQALPGHAAVLIARTLGRPRLGHVGVGRFTGDRGEPCSASRWLAAGRLERVWLGGPEGWRSQGLDLSQRRVGAPRGTAGVGASVAALRWPVRGGADRSPRRDATQLSLFAEAA